MPLFAEFDPHLEVKLLVVVAGVLVTGAPGGLALIADAVHRLRPPARRHRRPE